MVGSCAENSDEGWVEKKTARNDKHVRCKDEVEVEGACDKMALDVAIIWVTWLVNDPGKTSNKA